MITRRRTKPAITISLAILAAILIGLTAAHAAPPTWPSLSPSYRCDEGLAYFTLINVGADMQAGSQWYTATPRRIIEQGIFWIAAGQHSEWIYNAPHIPLTFAYVRPDTGQWVQMTQTCEGQPTPTPTPIGGQREHRWYFPLIATGDLCISPAH